MGYDPAIHEIRAPLASRSYLGGGFLPMPAPSGVDHDLPRRCAPLRLSRRRGIALELAREQLDFAKSQQLPKSLLYVAITNGRLPYQVPADEVLIEMLADAWLARTRAGRATK